MPVRPTEWIVTAKPIPGHPALKAGAEEEEREFPGAREAKAWAREMRERGYSIRATTAEGVIPEVEVSEGQVEGWLSGMFPPPECRKVGDEFFIVVMDHDKKQFCVHGPLSDDTAINERVEKAQRLGRDVNCSTSNASVRSEAAKEAKKLHPGYKEVSQLV